ncbi:hypothetical protein BB558_006239, partial [Smittium angustum]
AATPTDSATPTGTDAAPSAINPGSADSADSASQTGSVSGSSSVSSSATSVAFKYALFAAPLLLSFV